MRAPSHHAIWLLFASASPALAAFEDFFFAGNGGNDTAPRKCGTMPYECKPPNMCSKDTRTNKWYCCLPGVSDAVCWTGSPKCEGDAAFSPSPDQQPCTGGTTKYCCLKDAERCTQTDKQFNICWSTNDNALQPLNASRLNDTFKSLSAARPSASSYTIDRQALNQLTSTVPGASSTARLITSSAHTSTSTSTSSASSSAAPAASSGISGGAIGGIVGGVVGGLALIGVAAFFLLKRRKNVKSKLDPHAPATDPYQNYAYQPGYQPDQSNQQYQGQYSPQPPMAEVQGDSQAPQSTKYAHVHHPGAVEAPVNQAPVEMPAGQYVPPGSHATYK